MITMAITRQLYAALKALLALTVLLGVLYPAAILAVGLVAPFIGIKLIDLVISLFPGLR